MGRAVLLKLCQSVLLTAIIIANNLACQSFHSKRQDPYIFRLSKKRFCFLYLYQFSKRKFPNFRKIPIHLLSIVDAVHILYMYLDMIDEVNGETLSSSQQYSIKNHIYFEFHLISKNFEPEFLDTIISRWTTKTKTTTAIGDLLVPQGATALDNFDAIESVKRRLELSDLHLSN